MESYRAKATRWTQQLVDDSRIVLPNTFWLFLGVTDRAMNVNSPVPTHRISTQTSIIRRHYLQDVLETARAANSEMPIA